MLTKSTKRGDVTSGRDTARRTPTERLRVLALVLASRIFRQARKSSLCWLRTALSPQRERHRDARLRICGLELRVNKQVKILNLEGPPARKARPWLGTPSTLFIFIFPRNSKNFIQAVLSGILVRCFFTPLHSPGGHARIGANASANAMAMNTMF